jgi:hypothetical protein
MAKKRKKNPKASIKRGKWFNAKVRVTKGGKIQAKVPRSAIKSK